MPNIPEVVCIGFSTTDVLARGVGEIPLGGSTAYVQSVGMAVGGDALNQATVLARLGHKSGLITMVGDDAQGRFILDECGKAGVDVSACVVSKHYPTSTSIVLITEDGERSFISQKNGTADEQDASNIDLSYLRQGVKAVSIGSLFCSARLDSGIPRILKRARELGAVTLADMVPNHAGASLKRIRGVLSLIDYVVPSKEEALLYTGKATVEEAVDEFIDYGVKNVVVKLGGQGVMAKTPDGVITVKPYPANVVDTTGAGDNFVAGFISGILRGLSLEECLKFGSATASVSIGSVGATTGVKAFAQVQAVIQNEEAK